MKGYDSNWFANYQARRVSSSPKPQPPFQHEQVAETKGEENHPGRIAVSVVSYRARLLDPDNVCPKYFIDGLRYSGLLHDDRTQDIDLKVSQQKVKTRKEERTEITIEPI